MSFTPVVGGQFLSGNQVVVLRLSDDVVEHETAGREGGIVEREGSDANRLELHGFLFSGSDGLKTDLLSMVGQLVQVKIPSRIEGKDFVFGVLLFEELSFIYLGGRGYPYYEWVIRGPLSGIALVGLINYNQELPIMATVHTDRSQELPIFATVQVDRSQEAPLFATVQTNRSQEAPIMASVFANYVQVS